MMIEIWPPADNRRRIDFGNFLVLIPSKETADVINFMNE